MSYLRIFDEEAEYGQAADRNDDTEEKKVKDTEVAEIYKLTDFPEEKLPKKSKSKEWVVEVPFWFKKTKDVVGRHSTPIDGLKLHPVLMKNLKAEGYREWFPIQMDIIPAILRAGMEERDIAVCNPTGSGKTVSIVMAVIQQLLMSSKPKQALLVTPSRDLSLQTYSTCRRMAAHIPIMIKVNEMTPSEDLNAIAEGEEGDPMMMMTTTMKKRQIEDLTNKQNKKKIIGGIDIFTIAGLVNYLKCNANANNNINYDIIVLDEMDRIVQDCEYSRINIADLWTQVCKSNKRTMKIALSATIDFNAKNIALLQLKNPIYLGTYDTTYRYEIPYQIKQFKMFSKNKANRRNLLLGLLEKMKHRKIICFVRTLSDVEKITNRIKETIEPLTYGVSKILSDRKRARILQKFRDNELRILVLTDNVSRGLDLPDLDTVFNFHTPTSIETYLHRIGRTARGFVPENRVCIAITFLEQSQDATFEEMISVAKNAKLTLLTKDMELP
ncbi:hypothetical protein RFI_09127 [Reticulomyxa filosa]|uniref:ATP-dependent RNA helicase n=1 Tax=Reticulomyxa filosa TaxID=46433 RepID=X6NQM9_RETFI|nr:hypothetical protein RFI_09127 [Reticulomyxa filosa]|eukprot:ETO28004.1 hypothetical protein RFI_09127 [Reticulomyxa filosa]